jgi:hypothetical protein
LQFSAGNVIAIGIIGGIAAIALGLRAVGKEAREAKKDTEALLESAKRLRTGPTREQELRRTLDVLGADIPLARGRFEAERGRHRQAALARGEGPEAAMAIAMRAPQVVQAQQQLNQLLINRNALERELNKILRARAAEKLGIEIPRIRDLTALQQRAKLTGISGIATKEAQMLGPMVGGQAPGIPAAQFKEFARLPGFDPIRQQVSNVLADLMRNEQRLAAVRADLTMRLREGLISEEMFEQALKKLGLTMDETGRKSLTAAQQWAMAGSVVAGAGGLIASAVSGGGGGGFLSGLGGLISLATPFFAPAALIGGGLMAAGQIATAASRRNDPVPVRIDDISDRATRRMGPERFALQIVAQGSGELMDEWIWELNRRERLDARVRVPPIIRAIVRGG